MALSLSLLNRIYILYSILHPAIAQLIVSFDGSGRIYMLLSLTIIFFNINNVFFWKEIKKAPIFIWFTWCIYAAIAWLIIGKNPTELEPYVFIFNKIINSFIVLFLACYETHRNPKSFCKFVLNAYIAYALFGLALQGDVAEDTRMVGALGNALPLNCVCLMAVAAICYIKKWCNNKIFLFCTLLCTYIIFYSATRKAFFAEILLLLPLIYTKFNLKKNFILAAILIICIWYISGYIMENTMIGERFNSLEEASDQWNTTNYPILNFLGDRAYFYINGWHLFLEHPISGIGLLNFKLAMDSQHPIHSEYVVQLCELGIIGSTLYIAYITSIFKRIKQVRKIGEKQLSLIFYAWIISLLFISFTTWTYEFPRYFLITGIIIGYSNWKKENIKYTQK